MLSKPRNFFPTGGQDIRTVMAMNTIPKYPTIDFFSPLVITSRTTSTRPKTVMNTSG